MNILHVTQSLDPSWGGIARVLPMLAEQLKQAGVNSRIAVLSGDRFGTPAAIEGVEVRAYEAARKSRLGSAKAFDHEIRDLVGSADLVHLHGLWSAQNWSAGKAARKAGKPFIMTPHSMMMPWAWRRSAWKKRPIGWLFEHHNLRTASRIHALAEGEARHIRALGFNQNVVVIPNGLSVEEFRDFPPADAIEARFPNTRKAKWVLFLGRIAEQKGIVEALRACFDTLASGKDWHLLIAGPDEFKMQPMLQAAIGRKGLGERVTFTGMLTREEARACLGRASILLQPSKSEGLSMSILEAMAAGLPVIISDACNMPEVEEQGAGRVVAPDRRAISSALRQMVGVSDEERRSMGARGRELVQRRFSWRVLTTQYVRMYREAIAGN
ncbi:MAG TPA: glycosyltransferase [Phycisphaerae bacterium]|nr:glycosyltransferase [Phycisphaerae bacterium]